VLIAALASGCGSDSRLDAGVRADADSACDGVSSFAEALAGAAPEPQKPSESSATLASRVEVVLVGRLTGHVAHRETGPDAPSSSWMAYEIDIDDVLQGAVTPGGRIFAAVPHEYSGEGEVAANEVARGTEVVVFGNLLSDPPAGLFVDAEGLATACREEPPIGLVGHTPAWRRIASLTDLAAAVEAPTDRVEVGLWHCGIDAITFEDRRWEVPDDEQPFDGTNAPESFAGRGQVERVSPEELRYRDDSGIELRFIPDNGSDPGCA
jgi:hypothetical protein